MDLTAIIVDDERGARESLRGLIETFVEGIKVVAEASSVAEGEAAIQAHSPNVVFLDIEMPQASGFELLELIQERGFEVIFTTAYNQYALKAIKFAALDYLLKPVSPSELRQAIERARESFQAKSRTENLKMLVENLSATSEKPEKIVLSVQEGMKVVELDQIVHCQSEINYTRFYFANGKNLLISKTLKEYQELLEESGFIRIHQSHLINKMHIQEYIRGRGGEVVMSNGTSLPISRDRKKDFLEQVGDLI